MRVVLVHPTGSNWVPGKKDITATANRMAPLGLLSIAAWLGKDGNEVFVYDCLGPRMPKKNAVHAENILSHRPDLVGVSATTSGFLDGYELAERIKTLRPEVQTVFGGVHISSLGAVLLEKFEHIDYLCRGEGEVTLAELASGKPPERIDGLIWRDGDRIVTNPPRSVFTNLDALPFPTYEKLKGFPRGYHLPLFSFIQSPGATMVTSRGCPYQCSYCDRSVFKKSYRFNSAEYIYEHMRYLRKQFGIRHVNIYDDLFTANRQRTIALCEMLIRKPLGIQFNCAIRAGQADDELLKILKRAGCLMLSLGMETGDPELLEFHKPGVDLDDIRAAVRQIQANDLRVKGLFMMGLPGETEASIRKTMEYIMSLDLDDMNMSKFTPFHGAPIWTRISEFGTFEEDWKKMNCINFVFVPKGIGSIAKLEQLYNTSVKRFYNSRQWRRKFMKRLWQHRKSIMYFAAHLPAFLAARRHFEPNP
ncbi:MAG: radical SAM protein [Thermodesulfobacteriota bacterium]